MLIRVAEPGKPAFQLRPGEEGVSIFDESKLDPALTGAEVLGAFRAGGIAIFRSKEEIELKGMRVVYLAGAETLPLRLQEAHAEIQAGPGMTRKQFKQALKELELPWPLKRQSCSLFQMICWTSFVLFRSSAKSCIADSVSKCRLLISTALVLVAASRSRFVPSLLSRKWKMCSMPCSRG